MIITYLGKSLVKIQSGETVIALNPGAESDAKRPKFGADIALVSLHDPSYADTNQVTFGNKIPMVIDGPGEYEIGGMYIKGFQTDTVESQSKKGKTDKINTAYSIIIEDVRLAHLGAHGKDSFDAGTLDELRDTDILFLPIGGDMVLDYKAAYKVVTMLEPKIIIPVHYESKDGASSPLPRFLKEYGAEQSEPVQKLVVKKKDMEGREGDVIVLAQV